MKYVDPDGRMARTAIDPGAPWWKKALYEMSWDPTIGPTILASAPARIGGSLALRLAAKIPLIRSLVTRAQTGVVLGESSDRVAAAAKELGASTFEAAWTNFDDVMAKNMRWLQEQIDTGATILDIGLDSARPYQGLAKGLFYQAEVKLLRRSGFQRQFVGHKLINGEVVPVYRWEKLP